VAFQPAGFTWLPLLPTVPVVSYTTFSPSPAEAETSTWAVSLSVALSVTLRPGARMPSC